MGGKHRGRKVDDLREIGDDGLVRTDTDLEWNDVVWLDSKLDEGESIGTAIAFHGLKHKGIQVQETRKASH